MLQRYNELQDIIAILGMDELSDEDKLTVSLAHDQRVEDTRGRTQWIYGMIDTQRCNLTLKLCVGIQVSKCSSWSRVGQVIGRHINSLYRGDGTILGRSDSLQLPPLLTWMLPLSFPVRLHLSVSILP